MEMGSGGVCLDMTFIPRGGGLYSSAVGDTLPTTGIATNSICIEAITGKIYTFNGTAWVTGTMVFADQSNTFAAATTQVFRDNTVHFRNPGDANNYILRTSAIGGNRNITLPGLTGNDTFVFQSHAQTLSSKTLTNPVINGETRAVSTKTAAYTLTSSDWHIRADASSAGFTITLPTAVGIEGKIYKVRKIDTTGNIVVIDPNSTETIEGLLTWELRQPGDFVEFMSNGTNWQVVDYSVPTIHSFRRKGTTEDRWYIGGMLVAGTMNTGTLSVDNLNTTPLVISTPSTLSDLAVNVTTSAASSSVRLGIYKDNGNLYPGGLVVDAGTVATATDNTFASIQIAAGAGVKLQPGLYWLAVVAGTAAPTVRQIVTAQALNTLGNRSNVGDTVAHFSWVHAFTFAALPDPFPTSSPTPSGTARVAIYARFV